MSTINNQIISNMTEHYSDLLKTNCCSFGSDSVSQSIFSQVDTTRDYRISQEEVNAAKSNLKTIISVVAEKYSELVSNIFGDNYSKQLAKAEENKSIETQETQRGEELNESEKVVLQNIQDAAVKIKEYAAVHPEDSRVQALALKMDEIMQGIKTTNSATWYVACTVTGDKEITFNSTEHENLKPDIALKNLIHEASHYVNGDELSSISEEIDVERYAIETTEKILGKTIIKDKETYLKEFAERYADGSNDNYGKHSPGYDGIPLNAGFVIKEDVLSVKRDGQATVFTSNFAGWKQEHKVVMGDEKDSNGNAYPSYAEKVIYTDEGKVLKWIYTDYNKDRGVWMNEIRSKEQNVV